MGIPYKMNSRLPAPVYLVFRHRAGATTPELMEVQQVQSKAAEACVRWAEFDRTAYEGGVVETLPGDNGCKLFPDGDTKSKLYNHYYWQYITHTGPVH